MGFTPIEDYSVRSRLLTELRTYTQPYLLPDDRDTLDVARNRPYFSEIPITRNNLLSKDLGPSEVPQDTPGNVRRSGPSHLTLAGKEGTHVLHITKT